ncbi:MAG TPA: 2-phospho-L-lactate transferase CofD family protein [Streptosporangiaceae bacterium]|nr:2-phospho-L-lactate transferase CofD family protein [Streptosporangiaceae bacterium]
MRIVVPAGGVGAARFLRGLKAAAPDAQITVIGNTGDDITLFGLRICPDLDTVMYTLGGGINSEQGWGRAAETFSVREELAAYEAQPLWFTLGDRDFATHILRTQLLGSGQPLSAVTATLCERWQPGVTLLPMTDDRVETHVVVGESDVTEETGARPSESLDHAARQHQPAERYERNGPADRDQPAQHDRHFPRVIHFQEWWVRYGARIPATEIVASGAADAVPAPGVLDAVAAADFVLLPPSNPVVSVGTILQVPGVRDALERKTVVGVSPIIGGAPVRGMADSCLAAIGVPASAASVAAWYGPSLLNGWIVDDTDDADKAAVDDPELAGIAVRARPLYMHDLPATIQIAMECLDLAAALGAGSLA